jgi:hypothetical protein
MYVFGLPVWFDLNRETAGIQKLEKTPVSSILVFNPIKSPDAKFAKLFFVTTKRQVIRW